MHYHVTLAFLMKVQVEVITSNATHKLIRDSIQIDGIAQDVLERNCFDALE